MGLLIVAGGKKVLKSRVVRARLTMPISGGLCVQGSKVLWDVRQSIALVRSLGGPESALEIGSRPWLQAHALLLMGARSFSSPAQTTTIKEMLV
jgi:hypothetical protein